MTNPDTNSVFSGEVLGSYRDKPIYQFTTVMGLKFEFSHVLSEQSRGQIGLDAMSDGDLVVPPGLVYRVPGGSSAMLSRRPVQSDSTTLLVAPTGMTEQGLEAETQNSPLASLGSALRVLIAYYGYHWFRIATFRPDYRSLDDSFKNVLVFGFLYSVLGVTRWLAVSDLKLITILTNLLVYAVFVLVFATKDKQSTSLVAALFAVSVAVDLLALPLQLAGLNPKLAFVFSVLEACLVFSAIREFLALPANVRAKGYKASRIGDNA